MNKLRIATWNVERPATHGWKRPKRNPVLIEQIQKIDADIWILTETHEVISPGREYSGISSAQADNYSVGESCAAIWSRYPITEQPSTFDPETAICARIAAPVGNIVVYGSIITWANDKGANGQSRMWEEHYRSITAHGDDWASLSKGELIFCAAGDFNETLNDSGWYGTRKGRTMLSRELERCRLECLTQEYRIDHICLTGGVAQKAEVTMWSAPDFDGKPVSDHPGYHVDLYFDS